MNTAEIWWREKCAVILLLVWQSCDNLSGHQAILHRKLDEWKKWMYTFRLRMLNYNFLQICYSTHNGERKMANIEKYWVFQKKSPSNNGSIFGNFLGKHPGENHWLTVQTATNRRSDESRTTASAWPLSCYIVDDVTRPNMANTEYNLIILSHIVLAKFSITSREIFWSLLTFHAN
jgi:hypothetical protein